MDIYITDLIQEDYDENIDKDEYSNDSNESNNSKKIHEKYLIKAFGRLGDEFDNISVCIDIHNFLPYFFISIPQNFNNSHLRIFIESIKQNKKIYGCADKLISYEIVYGKPFTKFTGNDKFKFLKLIFSTLNAFKRFDYLFREELKIFGLNKNEPFLYKRYETNVIPLLRAIHDNNLKSIGWSKITKYTEIKNNIHNVDKYLSVNYNNIKNSTKTGIPKIRILSFDIEADSSHADFPIANKDYTKLSRELLNEYVRLTIEKKYKTDNECIKILFKYLSLSFNLNFNNNGISYNNFKDCDFNYDFSIDEFNKYLNNKELNIFIKKYLIYLNENENEIKDINEENINKLSFELYNEINRLNNQNNIRFKTNKLDVIKLLIKLSFDKDYSGCNINKIYTINNIIPAPEIIKSIIKNILKICKDYYSKIVNKTKTQDDDIIVLTNLLNNKLPEVCGDPVIQIGSVFKKFGETDPYLKHIITLNNSSSISNLDLIKDENKDIFIPDNEILKELSNISKNELNSKRDFYNQQVLDNRINNQLKTDKAEVIIIECKTEEEVITKWIQIVIEQDPDIVLGYNIAYSYIEPVGTVNQGAGKVIVGGVIWFWI